MQESTSVRTVLVSLLIVQIAFPAVRTAVWSNDDRELLHTTQIYLFCLDTLCMISESRRFVSC